MKSKRKLRFLIPIFCIVLSLVIYRLANGLMREREFQHMPEIYEIPNTSQVFTQNNVTTVRTNYIIKSEYTDLDLLHQKYRILFMIIISSIPRSTVQKQKNTI